MLPSRGVVQSMASARAASTRTICSQSLRSYSTVLRPHNTVHATSRIAFPTTPIFATGTAVAGFRNLSWRFWDRSKPAEPPAATEASAPTSGPIIKTPAAPTIPETVPEAVAPQVETFSAAASDISDSTNSLTLENIMAMPETIGYLGQLGLDFGIGASQSALWVLEHIHVYSGLPWWGSIFLAQFAVRALLFKPLLISHETSTRMQILRKTNLDYEKAMRDFRELMARSGVHNDPHTREEAMMARQTYLAIEKANGINKFNMAWGMLQIPISIGFFRVLSAMADIPVPSLETGGVLWFQDLSVPDPLYILPLLGPAMMISAMTANARFMPHDQRRTAKLMACIAGPVSAMFTCWLPAAVQWYFCSAAFFGALQNTIVANPRGRKLLHLPAIPPAVYDPVAQAENAGIVYQGPRPSNKSIIAEAKEGFESMKSKGKDMMLRREEKSKKKEDASREAQLQQESWEALRDRMARKEQEARMRNRRHL